MRSKSNSSCRRIGSTIAPSQRNASRVPVRTSDASCSGFDIPATACIAATE